MNEKELLIEMLRLHESGKYLSVTFATENYEGLKKLWVQGLSSYQVTRMVAGNVRARRVSSGVLTPAGVDKAKSLN